MHAPSAALGPRFRNGGRVDEPEAVAPGPAHLGRALLDLVEQAHGHPLQEGPAAAQALEQRHGAKAAQALGLGPQRRLLQRSAAGVHEQPLHQGEGIADPTPATPPAIPSRTKATPQNAEHVS
ncbi:MAG: hypothetical protein JOY92_11790 [Verrucomicrobia bacterium]|nr:hypothetical protein [Verrucomicrobiota bacterium]